MDAELCEVRGEARFARDDAKVRHQRETEPAADRGALNRGDDGLLAAEQAHRLAIQLAGGVAEAFLGKIRASRPVAPTTSEVRPRAERFALGCQYDGAALRVCIHCGECVRDLADQTEIEKVVGRPLDFDRGDVTIESHTDIGEAICWHRCGSLNKRHETANEWCGVKGVQAHSSRLGDGNNNRGAGRLD